MTPLTAEEIEELRAIAATTSAIKKPTSIHVMHRKGLYKRLVGRGLVTWEKFNDGTFTPTFRAVELTDKGRSAIAV